MPRESEKVYIVYVETVRAPGSPMPVVQAVSSENAVEVVRILLAQKDADVSAVTVKVEVRI